MNGLGDCVFGSWSPTIGDPTFVGWFTVFFYLLAGILSAGLFVRQSGRQRAFWLILATLLLLLAINKQLDLQSALTATGRCLSQAQGWYEDRRAIQLVFILAVVGISFVLAIVVSWMMRREFRHIWPALIGLSFLLAFVVIRAAGFHHFDRLIGSQIGSVRVNWILELGGIALIIANAAYLLLQKGRG